MENTKVIDINKRIDYSLYCTKNESGMYINVKQMAVIETLLKQEHIVFVNGEYAYIYKHGVYLQDFKGTRIKQIIQKYIHDSILTARRVNEVYALLAMREEVYIEEEQLNDYKDTVINFKNCMLDVVTLKTAKHDPRYLSTIQIPYNYKADDYKEPAQFINFVEQNCSGQKNAKWLLYQYVGYSMTRSLAFKTALMIRGGKDTGKSVLLKLIQLIIGRDNCSNIMLQDISDRFNTIGIKDKQLNIFADIDSKPLESSGVFKMIIGGDTLKGERKGMDIIYFQPFCKQIYSCNDIPKMVGDKSDATISKFSFIDWNHVVKKKDPDLLKKLKAEIEDIICLCVSAVHSAFEQGCLIDTDYSKQKRTDIQIASDPLEAFISDMCVCDSSKRIKVSIFNKLYSSYCKVNEYTPLKPKALKNAMESKGYQIALRDGYNNYKDITYKKLNDLADEDLKQLYLQMIDLDEHLKNILENEM